MGRIVAGACVCISAALAVSCEKPWPKDVARGPLSLQIRHPVDVPPASSDSDYVMGSLGNGRAALRVNGIAVPVHKSGNFLAYLPVPWADSIYRFEATLGRETVRVERHLADMSVRDETLDEEPFLSQRQFILASETAEGEREWILLRGTPARALRRTDGRVRIATRGATLWIRARDTAMVRLRSSLKRIAPRAGAFRVRSDSGETRVILPVTEFSPLRLTSGGDSLVVTVSSATLRKAQSELESSDSLVRRVHTTSSKAGAQVSIRTRGPIYGYSATREGDSIVVRIRRPPAVDSAAPLRGLTIIVDAGHPPGGATGAGGLREPVVTFGVAYHLVELLRERGAHVIQTRRGDTAVSVAERALLADTSQAHAFVSIHVDAAPDGWNPFGMRGTATFAFEGPAYLLAGSVQAGMQRRLGSRNRGVIRGDYAVVRGTWMPAVLCEGAVIAIPEDEAMLRTTDFRRRYAAGIADGLEVYFRDLGRQWRH